MSLQNATLPTLTEENTISSSFTVRDYLLLGGAVSLFGFLLVSAVILQLQYGESIFLNKVIAGISNCF